jgi:hypothetical protein
VTTAGKTLLALILRSRKSRLDGAEAWTRRIEAVERMAQRAVLQVPTDAEIAAYTSSLALRIRVCPECGSTATVPDA